LPRNRHGGRPACARGAGWFSAAASSQHEEAALKPLAGLKVLELARILAGPWAGQTLADLGADVVKIERPGAGDDTRSWGPPFLEGENGERLDAAYFMSCNRGKRSLAVDFERPEGREIVRKLALGADVLIENFKTGGLAKYGLDYESLRPINPRLIYCSITGFGHDGPYAPRPGYDFIIQGMAGAMDLTGEADSEPQKPGYAIADIFTGVYGVIAIQAALRRRETTGRGGEIDMALFDTQISVLANQAQNYLVSGRVPRRMGNAHPNLVPYQVFQAADGPIIVATGNDRQSRDFCRIVGREDLASDPQYASNADRIRHRAKFIGALAEAVAGLNRADLLAALEAANVPAGPINTVAEAFADPQAIARGMRIDLPATGVRGGTAPSVRSPIMLDGEPYAADRSAPRLGEHTDEVLAGLGFGEEALAGLRARGVIG
jgi:crotonobetainyl-CoA:carnitine CoA-transferase CaiB-like acyl-CoA transferase